MNPLRVLVWGENIHEQQDAAVAAIYPRGMHVAIAEGIREFLPTAEVSTATLQEPEHGLSAQRLATTDVLTWWGHRGHADVSDEVVERVQRRVLEGMGLIVLHSAHYSKIFKRLMGTTCSLTWRVAGERERLCAMLEQAWDGDWYRRAYFDDGTPLGSSQNDEGKIDSVAQSWAVLSGAAPRKRAERAMGSR